MPGPRRSEIELLLFAARPFSAPSERLRDPILACIVPLPPMPGAALNLWAGREPLLRQSNASATRTTAGIRGLMALRTKSRSTRRSSAEVFMRVTCTRPSASSEYRLVGLPFFRKTVSGILMPRSSSRVPLAAPAGMKEELSLEGLLLPLCSRSALAGASSGVGAMAAATFRNQTNPLGCMVTDCRSAFRVHVSPSEPWYSASTFSRSSSASMTLLLAWSTSCCFFAIVLARSSEGPWLLTASCKWASSCSHARSSARQRCCLKATSRHTWPFALSTACGNSCASRA
mmetsp:Transcript_56892/g.169315  ORF Transcript_56892/g.169315 Transcript_56892/m.169315 type:complete len:287 (-) Transcript_56892:231-1091(-)